MGNESLSQLSKDYSAGKISQSDYRKMRSKLIKEIVTGNVTLEENKYIPPKKTKKKSKKKRKYVNLQNKRPMFIAIGILCIVSIILIIGVLTLQ